jgi:hypothetical protein
MPPKESFSSRKTYQFAEVLAELSPLIEAGHEEKACERGDFPDL